MDNSIDLTLRLARLAAQDKKCPKLCPREAFKAHGPRILRGRIY